MVTSSSPLRRLPPTNGLPSQFQQISWSAFVQLTLEITVDAYARMRQGGVARKEWEEDAFTATLTEDYIQPLASRHPLHLVGICQAPVYTQAMKSGQVSTRHAAKVDIKLFIPSWGNYASVYFVWECKRIGDKRADEIYGGLISEYVTEGMLRFLDEEYAADLDDAGMLGYVLAGDVPNIVNDINVSLEHPRRVRQLSISDHLTPAPAIKTFTDVYRSHHVRSLSQKPIRLHHLFLVFDFDVT